MMRGAVDYRLERMSGDHIRVMDEDTPEVNEDEETEVQNTVDGEEKYEDMVWE